MIDTAEDLRNKRSSGEKILGQVKIYFVIWIFEPPKKMLYITFCHPLLHSLAYRPFLLADPLALLLPVSRPHFCRHLRLRLFLCEAAKAAYPLPSSFWEGLRPPLPLRRRRRRHPHLLPDKTKERCQNNEKCSVGRRYSEKSYFFFMCAFCSCTWRKQ